MIYRILSFSLTSNDPLTLISNDVLVQLSLPLHFYLLYLLLNSCDGKDAF